MNMEPRTYEWSFSPQRLHDIWENKQDTVVCRIAKPALRRLCHYNHSAFNIRSKTLEFDGGKKKGAASIGLLSCCLDITGGDAQFQAKPSGRFHPRFLPWMTGEENTDATFLLSLVVAEAWNVAVQSEVPSLWWQRGAHGSSNWRTTCQREEGLTPQDGMKRRRPSVCLPALQKWKCKHSQSLIFHYGSVKHLFIYNTM